MSIAVSAIVRPSRLLLAMVAVICAATAVLGVAAAIEYHAGGGSSLPPLVIVVSLFFPLFGFYHGVKTRKPIHIDISGTGQIRLRHVSNAASCADDGRPHLSEDAVPVRLLGNSTVWPHLLLLRLQGDSGQITVVPILPDSVSPDSFRALSVACRWLAMHGDPRDRGSAQNATDAG